MGYFLLSHWPNRVSQAPPQTSQATVNAIGFPPQHEMRPYCGRHHLFMSLNMKKSSWRPTRSTSPLLTTVSSTRRYNPCPWRRKVSSITQLHAQQQQQPACKIYWCTSSNTCYGSNQPLSDWI